MNESAQEKRQAKRVSYTCDVGWQESGMLRMGQIGVLSTSGAYIKTPRPCPKGTVITLRFCIGPTQIETKAEVVFQTPGVDGMGIRFSELEPAALAAIERIVQEDSG